MEKLNVSQPIITIVTIFAGRFVQFEPYLYGLKNLDYPKDRIKLIWVTNCTNPLWQEALARELEKMKEYNSVSLKIVDVMEPSYKSAENIPDEKRTINIEHTKIVTLMQNTAYNYVDTEWLYFLEDDVIAPSHSLKRLLKVYDDPKVGYASGCIFSRKGDGELYAWDIAEVRRADQDGEYSSYEAIKLKKPWGVKEVGLSTLSNTLLKMSIIDKLPQPVFESSTTSSRKLRGSDIILCLKLKEAGLKRIVDFDLRCLHIDYAGDIH